MNKRYTKVCPECKGNIFQEDKIHQELTCRKCGLVLIAPIVHGFVFPGFMLLPHKKNFRIKTLNRYYIINIHF